jgi:hypothetical protein
MSAVRFVEVGPDDWTTWFEIRLRALADAPPAFGSTYAETSRMTEEQVRTRLDPTRFATARTEAHVGSLTVVTDRQ